MTLEMYKNKRTELLNNASLAIEESRLDDYNAIKGDIEALDEQYKVEAQAQADLEALQDKTVVTNIANKSVNVVGKTVATLNAPNVDDVTDSLEYRKDFMNYVLTGRQGEFLNANANTKTTDVGVAIPNTLVQKIIEHMETVGVLYNLVTKTSYKGGVTIPTSNIKPVASWVAEGATSDKQKVALGSVTFAYHKLRCAVSVSLETDVMAIAAFEALLVKKVAEAMVRAIETAIVNGSGSGQPKGLATETGISHTDVTTLTDFSAIEAAENALPSAYENTAVWIMHKATFNALKQMKKTDKGYILTEMNDGGKPAHYLMGRRVVIVDALDNINTTVQSNKKTPIAILGDFSDYVLNINYNMGIREYYDEDTEDKIRKSVMLIDGKAVNTDSFYIINKKGA